LLPTFCSQRRQAHAQGAFECYVAPGGAALAAKEFVKDLKKLLVIEGTKMSCKLVDLEDHKKYVIGYTLKDRNEHHYRNFSKGYSPEYLEECFQYYFLRADTPERKFLSLTKANFVTEAYKFVHKMYDNRIVNVFIPSLLEMMAVMIHTGKYAFHPGWVSGAQVDQERSERLFTSMLHPDQVTKGDISVLMFGCDYRHRDHRARNLDPAELLQAMRDSRDESQSAELHADGDISLRPRYPGDKDRPLALSHDDGFMAFLDPNPEDRRSLNPASGLTSQTRNILDRRTAHHDGAAIARSVVSLQSGDVDSRGQNESSDNDDDDDSDIGSFIDADQHSATSRDEMDEAARNTESSIGGNDRQSDENSDDADSLGFRTTEK